MISVAMTTYNGSAYIEEQLRSLLAQSVLPDEIIICDDASTDGTVELLKRLCREHPAIRLIENPTRLGYIENFYQAISLTTGDYVFLCDQDDIWHENKIERTLAVLKETGVDAVCTGSTLIDAEGRRIPNPKDYRINPLVKKLGPADGRRVPISFHRLIYGNISQGCTYCITARVRERYVALHSTRLIHDHQLMFLASLMGGALYLHEELLDYRLHRGNALGFAAKKVKSGEPSTSATADAALADTTPADATPADDIAADDHSAPRHRISRTPFMVSFLTELAGVVRVPHRAYYQLLYWLRIPYLGSKLRGF